jgi:hypothetical protein
MLFEQLQQNHHAENIHFLPFFCLFLSHFLLANACVALWLFRASKSKKLPIPQVQKVSRSQAPQAALSQKQTTQS